LKLFARNKINLTKSQSRPLRDRPREYLFYVDIEEQIQDTAVKKSVETLGKICLFLRLLGSYPRKA